MKFHVYISSVRQKITVMRPKFFYSVYIYQCFLVSIFMVFFYLFYYFIIFIFMLNICIIKYKEYNQSFDYVNLKYY